MGKPDYVSCYRVLGVGPDSDWDTVREAYRRAAQRLHPDRIQDGGRDTSEQFKSVNQAFHTLEEYYRKHGTLPRIPTREDLTRRRSAKRNTGTRARGEWPRRRQHPTRRAGIPRARPIRRVTTTLLAIIIVIWLLADGPEVREEHIGFEAPDQPVVEIGKDRGDGPAAAGYFRYGSARDEVRAVQGKPDRVEKTANGEVWHYGRSRVYFEGDMVVTWEFDLSSPLRIRLDSPPGDVQPRFTYGASKAEVRVIQGMPERASDNVWEYGMSRVYFDEDGRVSGWESNPLHPLHVYE